jgi:VWFA-related protein
MIGREMMKLPVALTLAILPAAFAQASSQNPDKDPASSRLAQSPLLTSRSTLVQVPALVRNKANQLVYTLTANDFVLTDDGVPQKLLLDEEAGSEPLALVVDIERSGAGARALARCAGLSSMLDLVAGGVPHQIAVVGFDSSPKVIRDFTSETEVAGRAIQDLVAGESGESGHSGAAILDSLDLSIGLLREQPSQYRRAIVLISETLDAGSHLKLDEALRAIGDTNTTIYAVAFSSGKEYRKREGPKTFGNGPIPWLSSKDAVPPGPARGCMSRDPDDGKVDINENPARQAYDCLSQLAPPLRVAKIAAVLASDSLKKNVPETVTRLTGGEYFKLTDEASLEHSLQTISNHIPNRYILSFQPQSPHPGFHFVVLQMHGYEGLEVSARNGYWVEPADPATPGSSGNP